MKTLILCLVAAPAAAANSVHADAIFDRKSQIISDHLSTPYPYDPASGLTCPEA